MRTSKHTTFLDIANILAKRGTCAKRQVGCILVNTYGHIIGSGYNGNATGLEHCIDKPCAGASQPSGGGTSLYMCEAIHAEQNALLQCKDVQQIDTCYVTCSPCVQCTKLLLQTSCKRVIFLEASSHEHAAHILWVKGKKQWQMDVEGFKQEIWQQYE